MKRPDEEISQINGTLNRGVLDYIAWLEGFQKGAREAAEWMARMNKGGQPFKRKPYQIDPSLNCGHCRFSAEIDAPEGSDRKSLIICTHTAAAAENPTLVAQFRSYGCGPKATLWERKEITA